MMHLRLEVSPLRARDARAFKGDLLKRPVAGTCYFRKVAAPRAPSPPKGTATVWEGGIPLSS